MIRLILNVLWLVFGSGIIFAIGYAIAGLICFLLVVTIPFGVAAFRLANYSLWPFGRTLVTDAGAGVPSGLANVLWVVLIGWWLALAHIVTAVLQFITIIGIPFGIANLKLVPVAFWPLGRRVVPIS
ncbi:YccF domain-containing protein [Natronosporangium hydrolyticum]|uniref:YccF domain-containing protein n=1 Tax=Natronosporangium hydrolyticum TaxID=2811111 RepID=A0A895YGC2_9ACTN|nr:YccF domain-containing protein [Natronosporangium hydrolyticum]QSB16611.1 YccF domain-containing protein [Natronosporangium hydrolyticum]